MPTSICRARYVLVAAAIAAAPHALLAQGVDSLPPDVAAKVAAAVQKVIADTKVPSASVGIVMNGRIAYARAFGMAKLSPPVPARASMHYAIGSISKQFTVAAVMLLQQEGKLSIDDPVSKWLPELTRSNEVTLRNLMSHTSGYEDYAPQDYTIPDWTRATSAEKIVHEWATKPLDFEPGTEYQYSNTNYNIVGLIVQKVAGEPFWQFLKRRVLDPVGLPNTIDLDTQHNLLEPVGYFRHALGPLRPALEEAPGWYFADGEIAMPVADLLKWDVSVLDQSLLSPASYAEMEAPTKLKSGKTSNYGLGFSIGTWNGRKIVSHSGEVGGFVAANYVIPETKIAVAVLTNQEASPAAGQIGRAILGIVAPAAGSEAGSNAGAAAAEALARKVLAGFQRGTIDRSLFTANCNFYFDKSAVADYRVSLAPLGAISSVTQTSNFQRGGMTFRGFAVEFAGGKKVNLSTFTMPDGKIEQFLVEPVS
ncbi:MAG TPA: serine hydrolase domain-containing protein [Gemmatimonadales bacterium]|jgi:CubicO group peptidase (beta-lactamase class C family)